MIKPLHLSRFIVVLISMNLFVAQEIFGQDSKFNIQGKIVDASNGAGMEQVPVGLFRLSDSSSVGGAKTDNTGSFVIKEVKEGKYFLRAVLIGYKKAFYGPIELKAGGSIEVNVGKIKLESVSKKLNEVTVSGNRGFDASQVDKKFYSPSQLMSAVSGSAMDFLNNIPSVNLNQDGQMNFRGNENLTILIDGKPSSLTNNSLQQIPAQAIESIEVLSNPGAKFNPEGTAGIINIIMKKNMSKLNSGSVIIGAGTNNKYNGALTYNYQYKKVNLFLNYGFKDEERWSNGFINRNFKSALGWQNFYQDMQGNKIDINHFFRSNLEYSLTDKMSLSIGGNFSMGSKNEYTTRVNSNRDSSNVLKDEWNRKVWENNNSLAYDINVGLKREYKSPKHYLNIDFIQNYNRNEINNPIEENYFTTNFIEVSNRLPFEIYNWQTRLTTNLKIDYAKPINDKYYLEMGFNSQWRDFDFLTNSKKYVASYQDLRIDSTYSNDFRYLDDVYAVYGTMSASYGKLSLKTGLRLEQANTRNDNYNRENYNRFNYFAAFPSLAASYDLPKSQKISASYSRRINRPGPGQLNLVQDIADPTSIRLGNPNMRPEFINSFEVGYVKNIMPKFSFTSNLYYKYSVDAMTRFVTTDSNGRSVVQVQNLGNNINSGWEAIVNYSPWKFFNTMISSNLSINELSYTTPTRKYTNGNWVWSGRINATFKLPKEFDFQLVGFYRSPSKTPQGTFQFQSSVDLTLRKKIMKQRGLITASVSDIFNTLRFNIAVSDVNFNAEALRKTETRIGNISFKYNFGSEDKKSKAPKMQEFRPAPSEGDGGF